MPIDARLIAELSLFRNLTDDELCEVAEHCHVGRVARGAQLIVEGDAPGHPLYLLLTGRVAIVKRAKDDRSHVISNLDAPCMFGEMEVLAKRPALAGVVALQAITYATLGAKAIATLSQNGRPCILKVINNLTLALSERLATLSVRPQRIGDVRQMLYGGWDAPRRVVALK